MAGHNYAEMFDGFFRSSHMSSTYKPMFVRALADIGRYREDDLVGKQWIHHGGARVKLDLDFVAARLAMYYWDMEAAFAMRHMPERMADHKNPLHDIGIVKLVRRQEKRRRKRAMKEIIDGMDDYTLDNPERAGRKMGSAWKINPPGLKELASESMAEFRVEVIKSMQEVLDHLRQDMPTLYEWNKAECQIEFDAELMDFMKDSMHTIKQASCHMLARKLEKINPSARLIATMISDEGFEKKINTMQQLWIKISPGAPHPNAERAEFGGQDSAQIPE